jgi:hypothetical protein
METLVLHNPLIHFYLLYVTALSIALIWDYWRRPAVQNRARSVSAEPTRPDKEVARGRGGCWLQESTAFMSRNRRE